MSTEIDSVIDALAREVDPLRSALIIIDVQPDFMPGGALACEQGDAVIAPIRQLLDRGLFKHVVATQDWHPEGHISFASQHPGHAPFEEIDLYGHPQTLWPPHCIANTLGAMLHPAIDWQAVSLILRKGNNPKVDGYSAFRHNIDMQGQRPTSGLAAWLHSLNVERVYLCGLARDVCVQWSAEDAVDAGFDTTVLWEMTRPVTSAHDNDVLSAFQAKGIRTLMS